MADAPSLTVREIDADAAAAALQGVAALDPRGIGTDADMLQAARAGRCFELAGDGVRAVYVLEVHEGSVWVQALRGAGDVDLCEVMDGLVTAQCQGFKTMGFQTARRGLMRKATRLGWRVSGWILRKEMQ